MTYYLEPSLGSLAGTANVTLDIENVLLPAWSQKATRSPTMTYCTNGVRCNYDANIRVGSDAELNGALADTSYLGVSSATPAVFTNIMIRLKNTAYNHPCGNTDVGCTNAGGDDRFVLTHEIGHTLGLGHCDLDRGAMCHTTSATSNEQAEGTLFWTPQPNDILGIKAIYP